MGTGKLSIILKGESIAAGIGQPAWADRTTRIMALVRVRVRTAVGSNVCRHSTPGDADILLVGGVSRRQMANLYFMVGAIARRAINIDHIHGG